MAINIKRPETVDLIRKLADLRGQSLTETVHQVLSEAYETAAADAERLRAEAAEERLARITAAVKVIQDRVKGYKVVDPRPWKEILYDEDGLPR